MTISRDIRDTKKYTAVAQELIKHCKLIDHSYQDSPRYSLLLAFAAVSQDKSAKMLMKDFPNTLMLLQQHDFEPRTIDWPAIGLALDNLRRISIWWKLNIR